LTEQEGFPTLFESSMKVPRHFVRAQSTIILSLFTLGFNFVRLTPLNAADNHKPNVIFIMADDQGSVDANCYGAKDLVTPGIDALAASGVRFTQFYSAAPVCSPSRAGMLTGRYPWLVGMPWNGPGPPSEADDQLDTLTGEGIATDELTVADIFRAAGYGTAHIGKWHLGYGKGHKPLDKGFDYSFGFMGGCIDNYSHFSFWGQANREDLWENSKRVYLPGRFFPDLMIEKTEAYINSHRDKPFFIYFAINMPHYPYQGDPKWLQYYHDLPYPRNLYAAFVSTLDDHIAQLTKFLDDSGLRDNTIIAYQSDNGHSTEERAHYGGGSSGPYRGAKFSVFEGGIRLPAIISWPGHLPEGQVRGQVAHACDWLPTLTELAGVSQPKTNLIGVSFVNVIKSADAPTPHDILQWKVGNQWAVRQGPWKLSHNPDDRADKVKLAKADKEWFLANIEADPGEHTNEAPRHPDIVKRLRKLAPAGGD
jgi:arylsulfatase A